MSARLLFLLGFLLLVGSIPPSSGESPTCLTVYREGGAPAVFKSAKCPRWTLLAEEFRRSPPGCQVAIHQGRRRSQEDRAVCVLGLRIPFLEGRMRIKEVDVGIVAVFDGHNGAEASDMASRLFLEYFLLHVYFLLDGIYSVMLRSNERLAYKEENLLHQVHDLDKGQSFSYVKWKRSRWILPTIYDGSFHMEILKESLLRTIHDIDSTFSKEAMQNNLEAGSTATVILIADGQILAANVGDSKALLCSEDFHEKGKWSAMNRRGRRRKRKKASIFSDDESGDSELANYDGLIYHAKELTEDHHPDREDEKSRVEASGGYVLEWAGVVRVNGELALSRAIGDVPYKRYGVISTPEVTDWQALSRNDSYLVAASDGLFEKMTTQEVCDLLLLEKRRISNNLPSFHTITHNFAESIVKSAYERGTMDNIAAVVVPLETVVFSEGIVEDWYHQEKSFGTSVFGLYTVPYEMKIANDAASASLLSMEYFNHMTEKFQRLLVLSRVKRFGCFYLSENLNQDADYIFQAPEVYHTDDVHNFHHVSTGPAMPYNSEGPLLLYKEQKFCWYFGFQNEEKGQCTSPEVFAKYLGLLDSLPYNGSSSNSSDSVGYKIPDFRYKLKRKYDRGSYGEVWLAFHSNCSQDGNVHKNLSHFSGNLHLDPYNCNMSKCSNGNSSTDSRNDNLFILKRIMVERGPAAYLSGLREKYFGGTFLNASISLGGMAISESLTDFAMDVQFDSSYFLKKNVSVDEMQFVFNSTDEFTKNIRTTYVKREGLNHIARFVESFESESKEIWLVFQNEGVSLSKLIYTAEETKLVTGEVRDEKVRDISVLRPSAWWYWLRTTEAGQKEMQNLIWQLLMALKACHDRNITHRDIKPENMIICFEDMETGKCLREIPSGGKQNPLNMRIIDFGSAIDDFTMKHLYGSGPSRSEQTFEYTPPEALLNPNWFQVPKGVRLKYDMWSVGVVMLELILGSPHVFQINDRTRALMDQHLDGWSEHTKELAYKLRSYMEMCILIPGISSQHHQSRSTLDQDCVWPASWKCSEESFSHQVKIRDPLKRGFPNVWALRLVRKLLVWHPEDRLTVDEALNHPYFQQQP